MKVNTKEFVSNKWQPMPMTTGVSPTDPLGSHPG